MKRNFLDTPALYTRASRHQRDDIQYACGIERTASTGYPRAWWIAMALCAVAALYFIGRTA